MKKLLAVILAVVFVGCGGGSPPPPPPTVSISASPTTIFRGQSSTLTWSSTNATSCSASGDWSGTKATTGTEAVTPTTTGTKTFTLACTGAGGSASASATATVNAPVVNSVSVAPTTATLPVAGQQQFSATVQGTGSFDPSVTWQVNGVTGGDATLGTISASGLYTSPASLSASPSTMTVQATSVQDATKSGTATATIHIAAKISPSPINVPTQAHQAFLAKVDGSSNVAVTWTVLVGGVPSSTGGTITYLTFATLNGVLVDVGLYHAPPTITPGATILVQAVPQADPFFGATASVNLVIPQNRSSQAFPVDLGTSGGNTKDTTANLCGSGTLGSLVARGTSSFILSNNHVLALENAGTLGDLISQPGLVDANCALGNVSIVANLSQFADLKTSNVDAAIAQTQLGAVNTSGAILGFGAAPNLSGPPANSVIPATLGMPVAKSGRTTGLTCAQVEAIGATVSVSYSPLGGTPFTVTFFNQIIIQDLANVPGFSDGGDSGSLVVNSQTAQPIGLLFAGGGIRTDVNPIQDVLNALKDASGVTPTVVGGLQHSISCPAATATFVAAPAQAQTAKVQVSEASVAKTKAVKEKHEKALMSDPAVVAVAITASDDRPGEAAILVLVERGKPHGPIPSEIEGIQVKVQESSRFRALGRAKTKRAKKR